MCLRLANNRTDSTHQLVKRKFRWGQSEVLLYLLTAPIIFALIGLLTFLIAYLLIVIFNVRQGVTVFFYLWLYFMIFFGAPLALIFSFFVPPFVFEWIRKRRLKRLMRGRS